MDTNLKKASCGGCGNGTFEIFKDPNKEHLICECTKCKSTSEVVVSAPAIEINWHNDSPGLMHF